MGHYAAEMGVERCHPRKPDFEEKYEDLKAAVSALYDSHDIQCFCPTPDASGDDECMGCVVRKLVR